MTKSAHRTYISLLVLSVASSFIYLLYTGYSYYNTPLQERFYHESYHVLKPSGVWGHGLGIFGSLAIIIGVFGYMAWKSWKKLGRIGVLKYWLEFHIFLCTLGPVMILFHTSFKFGGLVAISFWSMVAVFLSGIIGRFIYIQIPRTIEGRELTLSEIKNMRTDLGAILKSSYGLSEESYNKIMESIRSGNEISRKSIILSMVKNYLEDLRKKSRIRSELRRSSLPGKEIRGVMKLVRREISMNRRISRLQGMQRLFRYWHVAHLPFALVMLVIMVIHVGVTIVFGYRWIF